MKTMARKRRKKAAKPKQTERNQVIIDRLAQEYIEVVDDNIPMGFKKRLRMRTEFRKRAKRRKNKLTPKQIELIMSQKGKMSTQECADWFHEKMNYKFSITKMTVWNYWNGKARKKEESVNVLDLLDEMESEDISIEEVVEKIESDEIKIK